MAYEKQTWVDSVTPLDAEHLNHMEQGISKLSEDIANKVANVYIGPVQPTDGTLYWLDTSESGSSGGETITYSITAALTNVTIDNAAESANEGESFAAALTVSDGYELSSVTITMGGADITNTAYASGNIYISAVTGDIVITAVASEVPAEVTTYTITNNLLNISSNNSAVSAEENASYTATLTPATDYALGAVTVTMGGVDVTADVYTNGVINIPAVTGDVVITATGSYAPTSPVFELAEPYTGTGSKPTVLDYNIVDEDKTFSVAIDFSATPTTGIYVFSAGSGNDVLGIRGQGGFYWFAQSQYYKTAEIATGKVTNKKVVLTYEKGSGNLLVHHVKTNGTKEIITLAKAWPTGTSANTSISPNGTINDLKIYIRVLDEAEINEYLGAVEKESATTTYQIGNLNATSGTSEANTTRCHTDFIPFADGGPVSLDGYYFIVYRYDENKGYIDRHLTGGSPAWFSGTDDTVEASPYIRVLIANTDLSSEITLGELDGTILTVGNTEYTLQGVE